MKTRELIERLQKLDPEKEVYVPVFDNGEDKSMFDIAPYFVDVTTITAQDDGIFIQGT